MDPVVSEKPPRIAIATRLRNNFLAGLIICAPVAITIWLTFAFIDWADSWVTPYLPQRYNPEYYFKNLIGRSIVNFGESILNRTPLVRTLYKSIKQIFETVLKDQSTSFKKVGLIEFPQPGTWALVFVAAEAQGELAQRFDAMGQEMVAVFLPPTPVPTAGFLLFVPKDKLILLDMTPEEAARLLISGGLIVPEHRAKILPIAAVEGRSGQA